MKKHTASSSKLEEDASDAISTATNNSGHHSNAEHSPSTHHNLTAEEADSLCDGSKKIRKKRNTYQKIDDDVRLKLLDAVKHGETLKSAAKKYKINYSSAKSILHTYRKEGRILKKSAQERNIKRNPTGPDDAEESPNTPGENYHLEGNEEFHVPARVQPGSEKQKMEVEKKEDVKQKPTNTAAGLVDNLVNLLKMSVGNAKPEDSSDRILQPQALKTPLKVVPKTNKTEEGKTEQKSSVNKIQNLILNENAENSMNLANLSQLLHGNPLENMKALDNFYSNFSNSLLGGTDKLADASTSAQPEKAAKDSEPLAEVTNEAKSQPKQGDEICVPHPLRFNTAQLLQEKVESKLSSNEDADWDNTIENAAMDTFKSFMDAQLLLCDALKKASYLKTLMQAQKSREQAGGLANNQL